MKNVFLMLLFTSFLICPSFGQTKEEKKEEKAKKDIEEFDKIKDLIDGKVYEFEAAWTTSSQGVRVNLMSRSNLLQIKNDSVDVDLSYFGVLQSGAAAKSGQAGVAYKGLMDDYRTEINDKKNSVIIKFNTKKSPDYFQFIMTVFQSGNTTVSVTSNARSSSKYDGTTRVIKEEK